MKSALCTVHPRFSTPVQSLCMTYATKERLLGGVITLLIAGELMFLAAHPAHAAVSSWLQGATMVPQNTTDLGSGSFKQSLTNLYNTGANSVAFVVPFYQSNPQSSDLAPGWNTPTDASLAAAIDQAHALGMSVNIKMHAESYDGSWRAYINPTDRNAWYAKYNTYLVNLAKIAQAHHVELITIGTEMVSTATASQNPDNTARWITMINNVRAVYSGKLAYGANSNDNGGSPFTNEKKFINFWSYLDYAGISAYYSLNGDNSVENLKSGWNFWNNNDLKAFQQSVGKPLLFAEIGYRSVDGAHTAPWDWARGGGANQTEQANDYEALMSYWNDYGYVAGIYWWDWSTNPNAGGGDTGYTPQNKLAQQVMTKWFTNPAAPGTPSQTPTFGSQGSSNPSGTTVGNTLMLNAAIQTLSGATASNIIVDIEVYNSSNQKVFQQVYENQQFNSGETRNFPANWSPTAAGTYRMTIGTFSSNWTTNYHWNNTAATITVTTGSTPPPTNPPPATTTPPTNPPPSNPPPSTGTVNVWWPTDGTRVSGIQPVKAIVDGKDVSTYQMFWQVDGGTLVEMANSTQDYPHKESLIDYTNWNWKGSGPYTLTFVAKQSGTTIGSKSVNIYTQ